MVRPWTGVLPEEGAAASVGCLTLAMPPSVGLTYHLFQSFPALYKGLWLVCTVNLYTIEHVKLKEK
jgi:hypothetical protein